MTFGGKRRLATVWALREYLESIRVDDPILYGKLDPELSTLETRKTAALLIGGGGTVAGMVVVAFGIAEASRSGSGVLALVGACTVAVSGLTAFILWPGRGAVRDWVDHHNELKPDRPLDLTLGIAPTPGGGLVAGALTW